MGGGLDDYDEILIIFESRPLNAWEGKLQSLSQY